MKREHLAFGRRPIGAQAQTRAMVQGARRDLTTPKRRESDRSPSERMASIAFHAGILCLAFGMAVAVAALGGTLGAAVGIAMGAS